MKRGFQPRCGLVVDKEGSEWRMMSYCKNPVVAIEKLTPPERKEMLYLCEVHRNKRRSYGNLTQPSPADQTESNQRRVSRRHLPK